MNRLAPLLKRGALFLILWGGISVCVVLPSWGEVPATIEDFQLDSCWWESDRIDTEPVLYGFERDQFGDVIASPDGSTIGEKVTYALLNQPGQNWAAFGKWQGWKDCEVDLDLSGAAYPVVRFWVYGNLSPATTVSIKLEHQAADGHPNGGIIMGFEDTRIGNFPLNENGWRQVVVPLVNARSIHGGFEGEGQNNDFFPDLSHITGFFVILHSVADPEEGATDAGSFYIDQLEVVDAAPLSVPSLPVIWDFAPVNGADQDERVYGHFGVSPVYAQTMDSDPDPGVTRWALGITYKLLESANGFYFANTVFEYPSFYNVEPIDLSAYRALTYQVKGDGSSHWMRLEIVEELTPGMQEPEVWGQAIPTPLSGSAWQDVVVPLMQSPTGFVKVSDSIEGDGIMDLTRIHRFQLTIFGDGADTGFRTVYFDNLVASTEEGENSITVTPQSPSYPDLVDPPDAPTMLPQELTVTYTAVTNAWTIRVWVNNVTDALETPGLQGVSLPDKFVFHKVWCPNFGPAGWQPGDPPPLPGDPDPADPGKLNWESYWVPWGEWDLMQAHDQDPGRRDYWTILATHQTALPSPFPAYIAGDFRGAVIQQYQTNSLTFELIAE